MNKSDSIKNIAAAIIEVSKEVKGIDKAVTVGTGNNAYNGVSDESVKEAVGQAMAKNGLSIAPISVVPTLKIDRWDDNGRAKQAVFSEVQTSYLLMHTSGEWIEIAGYGHGTDSQDKAAGKATTYALKYALLYTFMVPTKRIDDTDNEHSDSKPTPAAEPQGIDTRTWLNEGTEAFTKAREFVKGGGSIADVQKKYKVSKKVQEALTA